MTREIESVGIRCWITVIHSPSNTDMAIPATTAAAQTTQSGARAASAADGAAQRKQVGTLADRCAASR